MRQKVESCATEMDVVPGDLVPQQPSGPRVLGAGHHEAACKVAQPRRDDQGHVVLAFAVYSACVDPDRVLRAIRPLARRSAIPVEMNVRIDGRLPEPVEVGAYYVVSEMLTNAAKYARATVVRVDAEASSDTLRVCVRDDGLGGADPVQGSGLVGLKDRIEALGGTFSLHSPPGGGTTVSCELPVTGAGPAASSHD